MAHVPTHPSHRGPVREDGRATHDGFVVIGLVAVIAGAATGSLAVALAVFAAGALALGGAHHLRSHR